MNGKNDVDVLIDGRKYTLCGFESGEYLQRVASYINEKYGELKSKDYYNNLDLDLKNVLLAINIADDYFKAQKGAKEQKAESESKDKMIFDMKHNIIDLQLKIGELEAELAKYKNSVPAASSTPAGGNRRK